MNLPGYRAACAVGIIALLLLTEISGKRPPKAGKAKAKDRERDEEMSDFIEDSLSLEIQHSIGGGNEFVTRGTLFLKSLRSPSTVNFQQESLTQSQIHELREAARTGDIYTIRARSKFNHGSSQEGGGVMQAPFVSTFISACALVNARLSDAITVSGDGQGNVIGLMLTPSIQSTFSLCGDITGPLPHHFNTSVIIDNGTPAPVPDTQSYLRKVEQQEKDKKEGKDNRSFLQKYWMYIVVGLGVFMLMGGGPGGGASGGGGGGGQ